MQERGGSIVAISSVEGFKVARYMAPYTVTKAAVESLVHCAALELAPFQIRVNCIRPGYVPTEGTALAFDEEEAAQLVEMTPLRRSGSAEEIGDAVVYFSARVRRLGDGPGARRRRRHGDTGGGVLREALPQALRRRGHGPLHGAAERGRRTQRRVPRPGASGRSSAETIPGSAAQTAGME